MAKQNGAPDREPAVGQADHPLAWPAPRTSSVSGDGPNHSVDGRWSPMLRWLLFALVLATSFAVMTLRLGQTQRMVGDQPSPLLSANDRSRWVTVRSLVETGGYEIDRYTRDPVESRHWNTIDKVVHDGPDGRVREYSSKPPLLATIVAAVYWPFHQNGWLNLSEAPFTAVQSLLLGLQVIPFTLSLLAFAWVLDGCPGFRDSTRLYVLVAAGFGTYITTFAVTLNNHIFAVMSILWGMIALFRIMAAQSTGASTSSASHHPWFVVLGLSSGFAVANELPALAWTCLMVAVSFVYSREQTIRFMLPTIAVIALAYFGTNLIAHRTLRMPYSFRTDGPVIAEIERPKPAEWRTGPMPVEMRRQLNRVLENNEYDRNQLLGPNTWLEESRYPLATDVEERWVVRDFFQYPVAPDQWRGLVLRRLKERSQWELCRWGNWYDYPGSYWHDQTRVGVDVGEPSVLRYAFHCTIGHHGVFTLTPLWLLCVFGVVYGSRGSPTWRLVTWAIVGLTVVVVGFYLTRPQIDRNYGGQASALRWLFWLGPLWWVLLLPTVERWGRSTVGWVVLLMLLITSVVSAQIPATNPWVHPWPYQWLQSTTQPQTPPQPREFRPTAPITATSASLPSAWQAHQPDSPTHSASSAVIIRQRCLSHSESLQVGTG